jgi:hypothetical protein
LKGKIKMIKKDLQNQKIFIEDSSMKYLDTRLTINIYHTIHKQKEATYSLQDLTERYGIIYQKKHSALNLAHAEMVLHELFLFKNYKITETN